MKSVLLSIQPKWCELIANGKKTVEVRKTKPKIDTPFKCYIYCTNKKPYLVEGDVFRGDWVTEFTAISGYNRKDAEEIWDVFNGKVIGEFICDSIMPYCRYEIVSGVSEVGFEELTRATQLSRKELYEYCGEKDIYCWHISNLVIYDKPKELSEFITVCPEWEKGYFNTKCLRCKYYFSNCADMRHECTVEGEKPLTRPPQSWCYVEELERGVSDA